MSELLGRKFELFNIPLWFLCGLWVPVSCGQFDLGKRVLSGTRCSEKMLGKVLSKPEPYNEFSVWALGLWFLSLRSRK